MPSDILKNMMHTVSETEIDGILENCSTLPVTLDQIRFESKNLQETKLLLGRLKTFLGPLLNKLPDICFFEHFKSTFFSRSMMPHETHHTCISLSKACNEALQIVNRTVVGETTLNELGLDLTDNTGKEISNFETFVLQTNKDDDELICYGREGFDSLVSLTNIHEGVLLLEEVCNRFKLENCIKDQTFHNLSGYSNKIRIPEKICLKDALHMKTEFQEAFPHRKGDFNIYFDLFRELKNSFTYVLFLRNKGFIGEAGKRKFSQERNLITQEIQHTMEQRTIDDLWDAYSILSHFLDTHVTYHTLKLGLEKLNNVEKCTLQIKALHKHPIRHLEKVFALKEVRVLQEFHNCMCTLKFLLIF